MRKDIEIWKNDKILLDLMWLEYVGNIEIHVVEQEKWFSLVNVHLSMLEQTWVNEYVLYSFW